MRGSRWRKVRADLLTNRLRSGLAIASLTVGTTALGAMLLTGASIDTAFDASLRDANAPSAVLATAPFTPPLVDQLRAHPAVDEVEARRLHTVQLVGADGEMVGVELVAMTDLAANDIARIQPALGPWPPAPGAIVWERASLPETGLAVGDQALIHRHGGPTLSLPVTGTAFDVYEIPPMLGGPIRGYVAMDTMAELTGERGLNTLYIRTTGTDGRDQAVQAVAAVRDDVLRPAEVAISATRIDEPGQHPAASAVSFVTLAMQVLAALGLAIAVGLVVNTVAALLAQQRRQLGVMKAIGASSGQLTAQLLAYVLALSAVALAISVPAALGAGRVVAGVIAGIVNIDLEPLGVPVAVIGLQAGVALLVPVAAVALAVRRAARLTVREAITDRGLTGTVRVRPGRTPVPRPTLLAYRNAVRNRLRLGVTVLTVALSGAVLVGVISTGSGLGQLAEDVAGYADYDVAMALTSPVGRDEAVSALADDPGVAHVEGWLQTQAFRIRPDGTENDDLDLTAAPAASRSLSPTILDGRWLDADDRREIVINTHLADAEPDLAIGGDVLLEVEGHRAHWRIVGVASTTLVGPVAYVPVDALTAQLGRPGGVNLLAVELAPGTDQTAAAERLTTVGLDRGLPLGAVITNAEIREATDSIFAIVVALLLLVGAILAVVAVVGVAGTMTLGVVEQTREIGVLRTLGASTWSVRRLLLVQGLAVAAAGGVLGVLASIPVALLLGGAIGSTLISAEFPFAFSWLGVAIWIAVAVAIGALGATQPARVAARLTIRDTLAYE